MLSDGTGGLVALSVGRGSGKISLLEVASLRLVNIPDREYAAPPKFGTCDDTETGFADLR